MLQFAISGILIGAVVGARFTVFALVPVMTCAIIIAGASVVAGDGNFSST